MNDQDLIRKACKLADGFLLRDGEITGPAGFRMGYLDKPWQWGLDALAAQLTRQVDSLEDDDYDVIMSRSETSIERLSVLRQFDQVVSAFDGPDRTMNTLRAIVESGVLE